MKRQVPLRGFGVTGSSAICPLVVLVVLGIPLRCLGAVTTRFTGLLAGTRVSFGDFAFACRGPAKDNLGICCTILFRILQASFACLAVVVYAASAAIYRCACRASHRGSVASKPVRTTEKPASQPRCCHKVSTHQWRRQLAAHFAIQKSSHLSSDIFNGHTQYLDSTTFILCVILPFQ